MAKSTVCEIERAGRWEEINVAEALARHERVGRCVECHEPVKAHRQGKSGKPAAHFEHFDRNSACSLSDHR